MLSLVPRRLASFGKLSQTLKEAAPKQIVIENVTRPVGVSTPVNAYDLYHQIQSQHKVNLWLRFKYEWFSSARREERRHHLAVEFSTSGYYDMGVYNKSKGKVFGSPPGMFRADKALYFPATTGLTLANTTVDLLLLWKNKISIVRVFTSQMGERDSRAWFTGDENADGKASASSYLDSAYLEFVASHPSAQIVDLNLLELPVKHWFAKMARPGLRKQTPSERHPLCMLSERRFYTQLEDDGQLAKLLKLDNVYAGLVFLVDGKGRIRWCAAGVPSPDEKARLYKFVGMLEKEAA